MNPLDDVKAAMAKIAVAWNEAAAVIEKHAAEPAAEPVADELVAKIGNLAGFISPEAKLAISAIVDVFVAYERGHRAHQVAAAAPADPTPPSSPSSPTAAAPDPSTSSSDPSPSSSTLPTTPPAADASEPSPVDVVQAAA